MSARSVFSGGVQPQYTVSSTLTSANDGLALVYDDALRQLTTSQAPVSGQMAVGPHLPFEPNGGGAPAPGSTPTAISTQVLSDGSRKTTLRVAGVSGITANTSSTNILAVDLTALGAIPKFPTSGSAQAGPTHPGTIYGSTWVKGSALTNAYTVGMIRASEDGLWLLIESPESFAGNPATAGFDSFCITYDSVPI